MTCLFFLPTKQISAEDYDFNSDLYSQNTNGGIGLVQNPTARMSNDGEFAFGVSDEGPYRRLYSKMQILPWAEAVLRYTEATYEPYNPGSKQTWKDKGADLKIRVFKESVNIPELSIGLNDLGGTGAYAGEYIVASKRKGVFDLTLGLGWGRLGGVDHMNNILSLIDNDRDSRRSSIAGGGKINFKRLFSGESTSIFGGLEYFTPIENLSFKLEYDTSDYSEVLGKEIVFDKTGDIFEIDSRINMALNYRTKISDRDKIDFSLGYLRGNTLYANFSIHSNLNQKSKAKFTAPPETINTPYIKSYETLNDGWKKYLTDTIIWQMGNVGFVTHKVIFNGNELQAEISQGRFLDPLQAIDLGGRILANNSPKNIDTITVINIDQGIETLRATINRDDLVKSVLKGPIDENIIEFNQLSQVIDNSIYAENEYLFPNFYWEIKPHMLGTLQHQEKFYFWQLEALLHTEYSIKKGMILTTDIGIDIANNYQDYNYHIPDGKLYHVRQDRRLYLTEGKSGLRRMALDYLVKINRNLNAKMSVGYLEWMYGGIGGEILYMPDDRRWGVGLDAHWVKQREFDQKFSFKDYQTVTGFISYYRDIPFYDMRLKVSAGKFLAKDIGAQIDISRRFDTGARVGAIVALTDCDAKCVGEGSFNKWIYFELPMDLFYTQSNTRGKAGYAWSPLTKDAGVKVESGGLYNLMMNATDEVESLRLKPWSFKKIFSGFSTKPKN